jgi:hypothetical protein
MPPARLLCALTLPLLCACATPPAGPGLLTVDQIAAARQGTTAVPDNSALLARGARLSARADRLRRMSADGTSGPDGADARRD